MDAIVFKHFLPRHTARVLVLEACDSQQFAGPTEGSPCHRYSANAHCAQIAPPRATEETVLAILGLRRLIWFTARLSFTR
jgi:hypothetical protein